MNGFNKEILTINQYITNHKNEFNKEVGGVIRQVRLNKRISIDEMATRCLMSPSYINQIENGVYGVSLNKFIIICNALKIESKDILENFLYFHQIDDDILYRELQNYKNLSKSIIEFMKNKKSIYLINASN